MSVDLQKLLETIKGIKEINQAQHDQLSQLIKNNYINLSNNINEIKENLKVLQLSDKDQAIEIAKLWANAEKIETELSTFQENEKKYGKEMSDAIREIRTNMATELKDFKKIPARIVYLFLTALGIVVAASVGYLAYIK